ncbi:amino acid adenylation domain-containing protein [Lysinibacillus sp. CNPSo 3705]|uniref:non-ribosomal peptide synthetase n=1 Tax=Lysinibacillus sp. CNPSo 3705 TaxID=3028148 RepID=UPI002363D096|nr:amino acid adenylation domain-containing protein [Lysinibacillus sp. CNPSo 3705]MDD1505460.1 amino acid adenylation domain-containing protein [Lysinibacillus sp. CNPSo 3705]
MENIESISKLSSVQEGMLFHTIYEPEKKYYIVQKILDFEGKLNIHALKESIIAVQEKHDILRSTFQWDRLSEPLRITHKKIKIAWKEHFLTEEMNNNSIEEILNNDISEISDLSKEPPLRWSLIHMDDNKYKFVFTHHHIILDGWSLELLFEEIMENYNLFKRDRKLNNIIGESFNEYVDWLNQKDLLADELFWKENLRGFDTPTPIQFFYNHETRENVGKNEKVLTVSKELVERIENVGKKNHLAVNSILQGAWGLLLHNYTSAEEVVFGSTFSGRPADLDGFEHRIGMFINTLPIRVDFKEQRTLKYLKNIQSLSHSIQQHQHISPISLKQLSEINQKENLFNSILVFEKYPKLSKGDWEELVVLNDETRENSHYPISMIVTPDKNNNWYLKIKYDSYYLSDQNAQRLLQHYQTLILSIISNLDKNLEECSYMSHDELLYIINDLSRGKDSKKDIQHMYELFKENVYKKPNAYAVVDGNSKYTYQQLFDKTNTIAASLKEKGINSGDVIGIYMDREINLLSGILAIWKLGASFVPIDTVLGKGRIRYILEDAQIQTVIIGDNGLYEDLSDINVHIYSINELLSTEIMNEHNDNEKITLQNMAYTIYTSGSTGQPKGVMISHENFGNYIQHAVIDYYNEGEGAILHSSIGFDLTLTSLLVPLAQGKTVFISPSKEINNLSKQINIRKVSFTKLTPSHLKMLEYDLDINEVSHYCDKWILGGEALTYEMIKPWLQASSKTTFINEYGPTEATVGCTTYEVKKGYNNRQDSIIPIGKPINNTQVYILNNYMRPVPVGVLGEIYIAGKGVAKGYLNKPQLTKEKFLDNPFSNDNQKIYKTGDIGYYLDDGNMVYVGRNDDQIKVRGHRIEPIEIEKVLIEFAGMSEAKVISSKDNLNSERLIAYVVDKSTDKTKNLKSILRKHLPEYMVPSKIIRLEFLPLTVNLKVDIKKLPEPNWNHEESEVAAATTVLEENVLKIWRTVLDIEYIGVHDDYFDIGGHSLLAIKVIAALREQLNINLKVSDIFKYPTVSKLCIYIENSEFGQSDFENTSIKPIRKKRVKR